MQQDVDKINDNKQMRQWNSKERPVQQTSLLRAGDRLNKDAVLPVWGSPC